MSSSSHWFGDVSVGQCVHQHGAGHQKKCFSPMWGVGQLPNIDVNLFSSFFFFVVKQQQQKLPKNRIIFHWQKCSVDFRNQMQKGVACSTGMSVRPPVAYHPAINGHPNNDNKRRKKGLEEDDDR